MAEQPPAPPQAAPPGAPPQELSKGLAIAAMVLGIIGLALFCVWYISIPCAILAVILGAVARSQAAAGTAGGAGMAKAGLVCGLISLGLVVLFFAGCLAILGLGAGAMEEMADEMQDEMQKEMERQQAPGAGPTSMLEPLRVYLSTWVA